MDGSSAVDCPPLAHISLSECNASASSLQRWAAKAGPTGETTLVLAATIEQNTSKANKFDSDRHSKSVSLSADGLQATVAKNVRDSLALVSPGDGENSFDVSISFTVSQLSGEVFIGFVADAASANLDGWVNTRGSWGYGSHGLKGDASGYKLFGSPWKEGDVIVVRVSSDGSMFANKASEPPALIFSGVKGPRLTAAVWMAGMGTSIRIADIAPSKCLSVTPSTLAHVPFVVATRYPGGALSVTTLGRTQPRPVGYYTPQVSVEQETLFTEADFSPQNSLVTAKDGYKANALPPIAAFGYFGQLALRFGAGVVDRIGRVYGQDLRGDAAVTLREGVDWVREAGALVFNGTQLAVLGTMAGTPGDLSDPGLVLSLVENG